MVEGSGFLFAKCPLSMTEKAGQLLEGDARSILRNIYDRLRAENDWTSDTLEATTKALSEELGLGLGKLAQPMRAAPGATGGVEGGRAERAGGGGGQCYGLRGRWAGGPSRAWDGPARPRPERRGCPRRNGRRCPGA